MAIKSTYSGGGSKLGEGEHIVKIMEVKTVMTKEKPGKESKPMYTVVFQNKDGQKHTGYYVKSIKFMMKQFEDLKKCCGLKESDSADELVGRKCGILIEVGEPNDEGKVFNQIAGYGTEADVLGIAAPVSTPTPVAKDNFTTPEVDALPF